MKKATKHLSYAGAATIIISSLIPFLFAGICMHRLHKDGWITYTDKNRMSSRTVCGHEAAVPIVATTLIGILALGVGLNELRSRFRYNACEAATHRHGGGAGFRQDPPINEYAIRTKVSQCIIWFMAGSGAIILGLDGYMWRVLPWDIRPGHWGLMVVCGFGALLTGGAVKEAFAPATLLFADSCGITLYTACTSRMWDKLSKRFIVTGRRGNPCLIPWDKITLIGRGTIDAEEPALRVLCAPSVCLDDCRSASILDAWTGFPGDDSDPHNCEDRRTLPEERLLSGFVLREMYLKDSLDQTIAILEKMRQRWV
jgi:hypothetical protein